MTDSDMFPALILREGDDGVIGATEQISESDLPAGAVTVDVAYSTLNYKDAMIIMGLGRLVRDYPHVPGIDFSGIVRHSDSPEFAPGDRVLLTGWRVGEVHWGGFAARARVRAEWLVKLPDALNLKQSMAIGTAGLTAMLAVMALEDHGLAPGGDGSVVVTGASGGLGSVAVAILSSLGYRVAAVTGRPENGDYLTALGAAEILDRSEFAEPPTRALGSERWAGAIDTVAGPVLAHVLSGIRYGGSMAACGLAGAANVTSSVLPFLLRGVNLLGIDSVMCPMDRRVVAWQRLAGELPLDQLESLTSTVSLDALPDLAGAILKGAVRGRTVVDIRGG